MLSKEINTLKDLEEISKNITELNFTNIFNEQINILIPEWIKIIKFNNNSKFDYPIEFLPEGLEELYFGFYKDHTLDEISNFPKNLKRLTFGGYFNQELKKNILPENLTQLTFGKYFNQEIKENVLPKNITELTFGSYFNQEIRENVLPKNIKNLVFGKCFNQEIKDNILPENLTYLFFGKYFNKEINYLPNKLESLIFEEEFNKEIKENIIPDSLKEIVISQLNKNKKIILKNYPNFKLYYQTFYYVKFREID